MAHISARVEDEFAQRLESMTTILGLKSTSDLVKRYCVEGMARDSVDIEERIEQRLAEERDRLMALVRPTKPLAGAVADEEPDDQADEDDDEPAAAAQS